MVIYKGKIEIESYFSEDSLRRYYLKRRYTTDRNNLEKKKLCFILINPSYADELLFDKTNMLASNIGVREKFNEVVILNMFSLITKNSKVLKKTQNDWNDSTNDQTILEECKNAQQIILSWGSDVDFDERRSELLNRLEAHNLLDKVYRIVFTDRAGTVSDSAHLSMYLSDNPPYNFEIKKYGE
ncbi:DUF1643 domain-containing protein [Lysinibacillus fusiformis]|uniref:DUF1643 domain-containing protein n=1 Tax=Lysinibacillus fusiformis TaxID=28031 RepID=UPI00215B593B|nr:DUF1643 domain-containing protein [Lysinibacillus fusiformis]MCR8853658.1 DUF1643 domain-containing protein [Lysinibacillus fusiformis]WKT79518.1 DUF1643 domain-containing protein [Lysinibacillus fusiformis]